MSFCTNCGKENDESAAFCIGCGTNMVNTIGNATVNQPSAGSTVMPEQPSTVGSYNQPGTQGIPSAPYYQSGAQGTPSASYYPPAPQGTPSGSYYPPGTQGAPGAAYNQQGAPGTPYYQAGAPVTPGTPYYQNGPYNSGGPNYPGGGPRKTNKTAVIIVSIIIGLCLIAGGIFAFVKLSDRGNNNNSLSNNNNGVVVSSSPSDVAEPSVGSSDAASAEPSADITVSAPAVTSGEGLDTFDAATQDNIITAAEDTGMDVALIKDLQYYGTWYEGDVYTFMYDDSVIDLLLYDDGRVFSLETNGAQVYLTGYESFLIDDYLGYTTHFDESYPDNGYAFYVSGADVDSSVNMETSSDYDYVVEFVDANDGSLALAFFMPAGQTLLMGVPAGDYYIQYAAGIDWQGTDYLFGDETVFYKSDSIYSVYPDNDSTITLDINGGSGIAASEITIDDF